MGTATWMIESTPGNYHSSVTSFNKGTFENIRHISGDHIIKRDNLERPIFLPGNFENFQLVGTHSSDKKMNISIKHTEERYLTL
jgi:hypothetical protein